MKTNEALIRRTSLSANVLAFCRHLRTQGFQLGPTEQLDALEALKIMGQSLSAENFHLTLRATLARSRTQQQKFDELFATYWKELEKATNSKIKDSEQPDKPAPSKKAPSLQSIKNWLYGNQNDQEMEIASYSSGEALTEKDFATFQADEMEEVMKIIRLLSKKLAAQYNRRKTTAHRPGIFDLRRTLRQNLRRGGEIIKLEYVKPKKQRLKIVMLCDVSKSMDLYTNFLLQFMYGMQNTAHRLETFVFSTRLERITDQLRNRDFDESLQQLTETVHNWSGGTKIGASLHEFVNTYGRRLVDNKTIILIMSDGWDTGEITLLEESMRYLQRRAGKVIWLNPLAGNPKFTPDVKGMAAAMPFIDVFAPAHNVESLRKVVGELR